MISYIWGNVNHYKSVHHLLSILRVGIGNNLTVFKTNQLSVQVYFLLGQTEGGEADLFVRVQEGGCIVRLPPRTLGCYKR